MRVKENRSSIMRRQFVDSSDKAMSVRSQCELLEVPRSGIYYAPQGESDFNLSLMHQMDEWMLDDPTLGVISMVDRFLDEALTVNEKRIRRLMRLMAIYPQKNLSKLGEAQYKRPYLLRNLIIERVNQVWCTDITYIPMKKGFMYLTAIIDVYSRKILSWEISNVMSKKFCLDVLQHAINKHGTPEIVNSDQGSQYTSHEWITKLEQQGVKISMDGKGRALDNIYIERFWRTIKQRYIYLNPANHGNELYQGIKYFMSKYNSRRHQGIGRIAPNTKYLKAA